MANPGSIFAEKKRRYQGLVSGSGAAAFERARARLAKLAGRKTASDGDTFEFLALGEKATVAYLKRRT